MSKYSNFMLNEMKIKVDGIYYYRHRYCKCGCGERIRYPANHLAFMHDIYQVIPEYVNGHQNIGRKLSKDHKKQISQAMCGKTQKTESVVQRAMSCVIAWDKKRGKI